MVFLRCCRVGARGAKGGKVWNYTGEGVLLGSVGDQEPAINSGRTESGFTVPLLGDQEWKLFLAHQCRLHLDPATRSSRGSMSARYSQNKLHRVATRSRRPWARCNTGADEEGLCRRSWSGSLKSVSYQKTLVNFGKFNLVHDHIRHPYQHLYNSGKKYRHDGKLGSHVKQASDSANTKSSTFVLSSRKSNSRHLSICVSPSLKQFTYLSHKTTTCGG